MGLVVYSGQIAPAPADKSYQLWLVPSSGQPIDAGLVSANQDNGAVLVRLQSGLVAKAFAVTLEPLGGRPQPTGPKVLVGVAGA
jgi:anti-sigma-K factor RskA